MLSPRSTLLVLCVLNSGCAVFGFLDAWTYPFYADSKTYFYIYMPSCPAAPYILTNQNASKIKSFPELDLSIPMKVLVPGYSSNLTNGEVLINKYLESKKYNVVMVHWTSGTDSWIPPLVQINVKVAGRVLAEFLATLQSIAGLQMNKVSIISHGHGCTVAGIAGNILGNLSTIEALDPSWNLISGSVSVSSATYVQVIHTGSFYYGTYWRVGTADFYVNGGYLQPHCSFFNPLCNHEYATFLFINSLYDSPYSGCKVGSNGDCGYIMGGDPLQVYSGVFEVCLDDGGKTSKSSSSIWNLYGLI
ncbi:probable phospholipase A1 magnifin isoform X1 [Hermetia illucens]|uniref:probable phospholipase A1 magnifin isoform X1 n=1 Tax=Hermetia illucens TaxID=343691 RepID=UPI0018CC612B|nr:probable phospholipase A1 magnifin isoform X1 [Hermetia illucens]